MAYLPQSQSAPRRPDRVRFDENTPVVLRFSDGRRFSGQLQVVSVTGGLICLSRPFEPGSMVKLMFLTKSGSVLGQAQMLSPVAWDHQPFRFTALHDDDRYRLQTAIQSRLTQSQRQDEQRSREREQMEKFRAW